MKFETRLTDDLWNDTCPAWSPDGRSIAFASSRDGSGDVYVMDADGTNVRRLTTDFYVSDGLDWSPDGTRIAFLVDGIRVRLVRVAGTGPVDNRDAIAAAFESIGRPTWSSDSRTIAVSTLVPFALVGDGLNQIRLHPVDPAADRWVSIFAERSAFNRHNSGPVWSPDGSLLAFAANGQLWTVDTDERGAHTTRPVAIAGDHPDSPSWERDSQHVVFQTPSRLRRA